MTHNRPSLAVVGDRADSTAITSAIASPSHDLNHTTVAEGIEQPHQLERLRAMDCELGQGYLLGPPRPAEFYGADPVKAITVHRRPAARAGRHRERAVAV